MTGKTRFAIAASAGGLHLGLQVLVYAVGFAVGPGGTGHELVDVSLYGVAAVLTFPVVPLAERMRWTTLGFGAFALNSVVWALAVHLGLGAAARLLRPRHRPPPLPGASS